MEKHLFVLTTLFVVLAVSGCNQQPKSSGNETIEFEYYNVSNDSLIPKGDFVFKMHGENEMWIKPNRTQKFYAVFNNVDDDGKVHEFIARMHPSAANFDVMAAYKCLHFKTCAPLIRDMNDMTLQPSVTETINYTFVGLNMMGFSVPEDAVKGVYLYNMVACQDMEFSECIETEANWGPNIPIILNII
ncbi:MAG: hypothetical protein KAS04_03550 [Candidatus Aenigmarchaeota archaeon]|nr:hypothetical protein [Candidatus Aenigmarchaeota archaeon]